MRLGKYKRDYQYMDQSEEKLYRKTISMVKNYMNLNLYSNDGLSKDVERQRCDYKDQYAHDARMNLMKYPLDTIEKQNVDGCNKP